MLCRYGCPMPAYWTFGCCRACVTEEEPKNVPWLKCVRCRRAVDVLLGSIATDEDRLCKDCREKIMKPYGLPRTCSVEWPDMADIREFGRPGHVGNLVGKGGDIRSNFKSARRKAQIRRYFKRRARRTGKLAIEHDK